MIPKKIQKDFSYIVVKLVAPIFCTNYLGFEMYKFSDTNLALAIHYVRNGKNNRLE